MAQQPVNDDDLNLIYNATDVGINTSSGEGWGLISFEHAATGAPQLVPAHSACEELWTTVDTVLPIRSKGEHVGLGMLRKFVEPDDIAATLENLYSDKQEAYKWDRIAAEWDDLLQRVRLDSASVR
jgi:glycosyltransferase involved in cell wall biosynthesis